MFDPVSIGMAISVGSKAFSMLKQGIAAGREIQDMASQLSEWGKAVSDIAYAAEKADEPPGIFKTLFGGGNQKSAIDIFAAQKQCEQQRRELKQLVSYSYGHDAWIEFQAIERRVREQQREQVYRRREIIESIMEFLLWSGIILVTVALAGVGLYVWGRYLGRW
jgi:preprotein translocase subunit SecF